MSSILDSQMQPTKLRAGDYIGFYTERRHLVLKAAAGDRLHWANGDDKKIADFIRNESDFALFVEILAETHGLSAAKSPRCAFGPTYVFI